MAIRKMKIARPAARKSSGKNKPSKSGSSRQSSVRKPVAEVQAPQQAQPPNPRRRFVELPKVPGELPVPVATFYF